MAAVKGNKGRKAQAGAAQAGAAPAGGGSMTWLLGVACGVAVTFATPYALLGGVLLAPAVLAAVFEAQPGRPVTRVVLVSAAGMMFVPLWHLNAGGATVGLALDMLADPAVLCPAWLASASGWAVCEVLPILLQGVANRRAAGRMAALRHEAAALREEWDLEGEL